MSFPFSGQPVQGIILPVKIWRAKHWPNQRLFLDGVGFKSIRKNQVFHLKERQSFTDRFGYHIPQPASLNFPTPNPATDRYGAPTFECTDEYGSKYSVPFFFYLGRTTKTLSGQLPISSICENFLASLTTSPTSHSPTSTVVTEIATNPQKLIDLMTYVYIGAGLATLLLVTGALIFLVMWAQKRKTRQRVNNTDSL